MVEIAIPLFVSDLIDLGIGQANMGEVWRLGIYLAIFAVLELAAGAGAAWPSAGAFELE